MTSSSSSSSRSWEYDVFLSFRGTDTRDTFVDHLYSVLLQQGIYTYKDDQTLPRGEIIGPSLLKAIEESQIAVVIFSENYVDSSWCMQELAHIMKCKDERGQIVIPIFYHVDPSELRNQKRKFGEAFAKHESQKKNVQSWRKALADAGNLSGYTVNGPETIFIKQMVGTISNRLCPAISNDDEDLIGIKPRLQDLKSKMEMESDGVLMVGIWGLGGGGKTTLASAYYDEIFSKFDGFCFLKDVREESSKHGLPKLQKDILSMVLKQEREKLVGDVGRLIKSRFRQKKVLMVLDDVDHLDQLKELAGSNSWFGKGSQIIITTRDKHLLNAHKVNVVYDISLLNKDEAMNLFHKHVLGHGRPIEDYEMLSKDVVSYARGLPLALKVLGSFLCDKDTTEWKSALARLKDIPETDIVEKLKISYDGLKPMEKELFLDIACFCRGKEKDEAMVILDACGFHSTIGVKVLIQKALITVSKKGWFDMHDLIQEMGHYIVREENPENPELRSRVWQRKDVVKIFAMDAMKENDRIEALQVSLPLWMTTSSLRVVSNMKKLRWISWHYYLETPLPREFQPMKLCCLVLEKSSLHQLWKGHKYLPNLKVLNLSDSTKLIRIPDLYGLPCLERMILHGCWSLKEIHPSIGCHERLAFVDMRFCRSLEIFPPIIRMKKLETLLLTDCFKLRKFPKIQNSLDNLAKLDLGGSGVEVVPSSIGQYCTNLVYLDLTRCHHLETIEGNFHHLKRLKGLYLHGCLRPKNIPVEGLFDVKCSLQVLTSFFNLHQGMASLKLFGFSSSLKRLNLNGCHLVDGDMSSVHFAELSNLEILDLGSNGFSRLHSSLLQLPRLKYLNLSDCKRLVALPDLPSSIAILKANECDSLKVVGELPTNLKWLWKVSLSLKSILGDVKRLILSMIQGDAIQDYFTSLHFGGKCISMRGCERETFMLQLPWNWYNDFCGFLIYIGGAKRQEHLIRINDVMGMDYEDNVLKGFDETHEIDESEMVSAICYISFGSLRHTSWWNSRHNTISFSIKGIICLKVELVPRSQDDSSIERAKDTTYRSKFWDEESPHRKTFEIIRDSRSCINISWFHDHCVDMFRQI
ncbi:hypothetical protein OSB04_018668 [Centaurea solstitialis]|uniref:TIR domain-containing protein n=1 Tax=Centaurea solstitialis TaxID=347529 RepID=A0AA38T5B1_9ASTR|nr:hypothetical protein OSB04_018668 [Centaurea solstitialis]